MDFKELNYVIAVAKHQNITKAAQDLYISQPSLSKYIKNLETNMGVRLFNRLGNRFILTYAGECYVENAKEILLLKDKLNAQMLDIVNLDKGKLNIAFPYTRGSYMIPATIPNFVEQYPNVEVNLIENHSSNLEELLLNGDADIAILNAPINSPDLDYEILGDEEIVLVTSKKHPLANCGELTNDGKYPWIDIRKFKDERFILQFPNQRTGQIADKIFKELKFKPDKVFRTRGLISSLRLATSNFGVCFISENHLKYLTSETKPMCFSVGNKSTKFKLVVAYRKGSYLPHYARDYIQIIKNSI
ncbi:MAG: LysR family transcriptional regulator [Peptostreptococcaceae bacterium]